MNEKALDIALDYFLVLLGIAIGVIGMLLATAVERLIIGAMILSIIILIVAVLFTFASKALYLPKREQKKTNQDGNPR